MFILNFIFIFFHLSGLKTLLCLENTTQLPRRSLTPVSLSNSTFFTFILFFFQQLKRNSQTASSYFTGSVTEWTWPSQDIRSTNWHDYACDLNPTSGYQLGGISWLDLPNRRDNFCSPESCSILDLV